MTTDPEKIVGLAVLQLEVEQLRTEVQELTQSTRALVEAWNAAGKVIALVRLLASIIAALGVIWLFFKSGFAKTS